LPTKTSPSRRAALLFASLALLTLAPAARAEEAAKEKRYFYHGRDYGSEASFNPFWVFLNRGFDALQLRRDARSPLTGRDFALNAGNVLDNLAEPGRAIETYGLGRFVREEVFPLDFTPEGSRWVPNYGLHLFGGGVDFVAMREWYADQRAPAPALLSGLTLLGGAFLNETIENYGIRGPNTDAIADIYLFDLGGILLFSVDEVAEFFSQTILVSDWSLQPVYTLPRGQLHNQGNYFAVKWPLPFHEPLRLFGYGGYSNLAGLSYRAASGYSLSLAGGVKVDEVVARKIGLVDNIITFQPSAALFLDHDESLLASVQIADVPDYFIHLNVYPNAFFRTDPAFGFFAVAGQDGRFLAGLAFAEGPWGLGVGPL
jgi:hypothetical protein